MELGSSTSRFSSGVATVPRSKRSWHRQHVLTSEHSLIRQHPCKSSVWALGVSSTSLPECHSLCRNYMLRLRHCCNVEILTCC